MEFRFRSFPLRKISKASVSVTFPLIALCFHVNPRLHTHQYSVCAWPALNVHMDFRSEAAEGTAFGVVAASLRKPFLLFPFLLFPFFYFYTFYFILFLTSFLFVCLHFGVYTPVRHNICINVIG